MTDLSFTDSELSELAYLAANGLGPAGLSRRELGLDHPLHRIDDHLWERGWVVMSRVPPDQRAVTA